MMKLVILLGLSTACLLFGQRVDPDGRAWLNANTDPAALNINGAWYAAEFGTFNLTQASGNRDIAGKDESYDIEGVVSGTKVFLVLSKRGRISYSAEMSPDGENAFTGRYADGLSWKSGTRLIHISRVGAPDPPAAGPKSAGHVVVYRTGRYMGSRIKPSVYCDDREAALIYSGKYFTIALPPGKHTISSSDQYTLVSLDVQSGGRYYVRVDLSNSEFIRATFKVTQVESAEAAQELHKLKPEDPSRFARKDIVSGELPGK